jgi:competence ComEA-like helix-hairpin-helix protein
MFTDLTPQERQALVVIAVLIAGGAAARHWATRAEAGEWLAYSTEAADSMGPGAGSALQARVVAELTLEQIRREPLGPDERIDPNRAPAEQLDRLPRVGPALAERIIAERQTGGPFTSVADLDRVSGIGPAMLEAIAPHLDLRNAPVTRTGMVAGLSTPGGTAAGGLAGAPRLSGLGATGPPLLPSSLSREGATGGRIDLNRASAQELEALPGVGPAIAERIVEYRREHGPFSSFEDLEEVSGIGPRIRERIEAVARL